MHITKEHIEEMKAQMPEMPRERRNRLKGEWLFQSPLHGRGTAEFHLIDTRNICQPRLDMLLGILLNQYRGGGGVQGEGHEGA